MKKNKKTTSEFTRQWIIENAIPIIATYQKGVLTIRGLHYRLVSKGMTNDLGHYKRVVTAMTQARWEGLGDFDSFVDNDREMIGETTYEETDVDREVKRTKFTIKDWLNNYRKNRWENQPYFPEVFIEKKALQGVFQVPCDKNKVALGACKGYPSLTFLYDTANRMKEAAIEGKKPIILYFGDYDPSGEDIPRSIRENLLKMGVNDIELKRFALMEKQVIDMDLPLAPKKEGDNRTASWDGLGQVELDAIEPEELQQMCQNAIDSVFDYDLYDELEEKQRDETKLYRSQLKEFIIEFEFEDE